MKLLWLSVNKNRHQVKKNLNSSNNKKIRAPNYGALTQTNSLKLI